MSRLPSGSRKQSQSWIADRVVGSTSEHNGGHHALAPTTNAISTAAKPDKLAGFFSKLLDYQEFIGAKKHLVLGLLSNAGQGSNSFATGL
jgi:hypothetical protein